MCGINGFNWKDETLVLKMNEATRHRGPDATGVYVDESISLGNNRLSIIDLDPRANQPMTDTSGDLIIVYNGEIYNFLDIKKEIGGRYNFRTTSDTEVVLAAYTIWGIRAFAKFNGMFAFALWNKKTKELMLVRDPVGIKPLYYYLDDGKLVFSSEIKGILEAPVPRLLNDEIFTTFLKILYVPAPFTGIKNIFKLPQGHYATWKNGTFEIKGFTENKKSVHEAKTEDKLKTVIEDAVSRQLISDRPVGIYLSGGIDSSILLHAMSRVHSNVNSYSVGFNLPDKKDEEKFNADFSLAAKTARFFGSNHHEFMVSPADVKNNLEAVLGHADALISNPTSIPMALLASFTRKESVVVLSGDGGDELFGGYERYRYAGMMDLYAQAPNFLRSILSWIPGLERMELSAGVSLYERFMFQKNTEIGPVLGDKVIHRGAERKYFEKYFGDFLKRTEALMSADFESWLPDQALALADQMSMYASLEQRVPFLDLEVVEFAKKIPGNDKVGLFDKKKMLKRSFRKDLPEFLFTEPKRGWFAPGAKWLRDPDILTLAKEILSPGYYSPTEKLINWQNTRTYLENHVNGTAYHANILWALLTFQIWARRYKVLL